MVNVGYMQKGDYNSRLFAYTFYGAGNEARTRDPQLGKLMLYRLSYSRKWWYKCNKKRKPETRQE